jgi:hypothetical protein
MNSKKMIWGWVAFALWAVLIIAGIMAKRIWGHPDWMVFFHLPAAVALVWAFRILSYDVRQRYKLTLKQQRQRRFNEFGANKFGSNKFGSNKFGSKVEELKL